MSGGGCGTGVACCYVGHFGEAYVDSTIVEERNVNAWEAREGDSHRVGGQEILFERNFGGARGRARWGQFVPLFSDPFQSAA